MHECIIYICLHECIMYVCISLSLCINECIMYVCMNVSCMYLYMYVCISPSLSVCICVNDTGTMVIASAFFSSSFFLLFIHLSLLRF